ncbi:acyltransferase family protein [Aestuariibacter salexigens]|uniref:acyltransferase family protein n=1 Tax=Aestuariibacter salexigens TaxID=226010 RepID=UPI0003FEB944|nr:acyltransferase [Aestuariibacter salexigens]
MNRQFSVYLDPLRLAAALTVFFSHLIIFGNPLLWRFKMFPAHEAVIIFFVLSGFVIAYVVLGRGEGAKEYTINRLTRIYSVVIPAMLITYLSLAVVTDYAPERIDWFAHEFDGPVYTFLNIFFMTHQSWQQVLFYTNAPIWSIAFEMLYYLAFGILVFLKGWKKWVGFAAVCILMGPNIFLYFPIWLFGVLAYRIIERRNETKSSYNLLITFTPLIVAIVIMQPAIKEITDSLSGLIVPEAISQFFNAQSKNILHDYIFGALVAIHFVGASRFFQSKNVFKEKLSGWIRHGSQMTFALYLLHLPLLYALTALVTPKDSPVLHAFAALVGIPLLIYAMSLVIEKNKIHLKSLLLWVVSPKNSPGEQK